jgi:hypothetical protein
MHLIVVAPSGANMVLTELDTLAMIAVLKNMNSFYEIREYDNNDKLVFLYNIETGYEVGNESKKRALIKELEA